MVMPKMAKDGGRIGFRDGGFEQVLLVWRYLKR